MARAEEQLLAWLADAVARGTFVKLTLSRPCGGDGDLQRVLLRPVALRAGLHVACVWRYRTRDITRNLTPAAAAEWLARDLGTAFLGADLYTTERTVHYEARANAAARLRQAPPQHKDPPALAHDRDKVRPLALRAAPWLAALGVTTPAGQVKKGMEGKLRQIEKFVEVLEHHLPPELWSGRAVDPDAAAVDESQAPRPPLRVVDMGAGKGYLTFATAAWLRHRGVAADVLGVEARAELVAASNAIARAHDCHNLRFVCGSIADLVLPACDVLLALHACDTATDDALAKGIAAGAALLIVSPCCHQELRPQLAAPRALAPALRHGILRERQAELVTDGLRAALLAAAGYDARVFEFVASEHSAKNLLVVGTRRCSCDRAAGARAARALAAEFGVREQRLARHLGVELTAAAGPPASGAEKETGAEG